MIYDFNLKKSERSLNIYIQIFEKKMETAAQRNEINLVKNIIEVEANAEGRGNKMYF